MMSPDVDFAQAITEWRTIKAERQAIWDSNQNSGPDLNILMQQKLTNNSYKERVLFLRLGISRERFLAILRDLGEPGLEKVPW